MRSGCQVTPFVLIVELHNVALICFSWSHCCCWNSLAGRRLFFFGDSQQHELHHTKYIHTCPGQDKKKINKPKNNSSYQPPGTASAPNHHPAVFACSGWINYRHFSYLPSMHNKNFFFWTSEWAFLTVKEKFTSLNIWQKKHQHDVYWERSLKSVNPILGCTYD